MTLDQFKNMKNRRLLLLIALLCVIIVGYVGISCFYQAKVRTVRTINKIRVYRIPVLSEEKLTANQLAQVEYYDLGKSELTTMRRDVQWHAAMLIYKGSLYGIATTDDGRKLDLKIESDVRDGGAFKVAGQSGFYSTTNDLVYTDRFNTTLAELRADG